jgi:hypothetical protein
MCCALSNGSPRISELGELSRDRVWAELRTEIKDSRIRDGGKSESESELEELRRCQNFAKSVESRIRLLDSIFELKIIHAREVAYMPSRVIRE